MDGWPVSLASHPAAAAAWPTLPTSSTAFARRGRREGVPPGRHRVLPDRSHGQRRAGRPGTEHRGPAPHRSQLRAERRDQEDFRVGSDLLRADSRRHDIRHELRPHAGTALDVGYPVSPGAHAAAVRCPVRRVQAATMALRLESSFMPVSFGGRPSREGRLPRRDLVVDAPKDPGKGRHLVRRWPARKTPEPRRLHDLSSFDGFPLTPFGSAISTNIVNPAERFGPRQHRHQSGSGARLAGAAWRNRSCRRRAS